MFSENVFCVSKTNRWAETSTGHGRRLRCPFALLLPLCAAPWTRGWGGRRTSLQWQSLRRLR